MAALDRALALAEVDDVAVRIGEHLHLDVPGILEIALDVDGRVGEVRLPLALGGLERARDAVGALDELEPLPPPPEAALSAIGQPISLPISIAWSAVSTGSVVPGTMGTPAACIAVRAAVFFPISSMASAGGPIHVSPASSTARANSAFSARKP